MIIARHRENCFERDTQREARIPQCIIPGEQWSRLARVEWHEAFAAITAVPVIAVVLPVDLPMPVPAVVTFNHEKTCWTVDNGSK